MNMKKLFLFLVILLSTVFLSEALPSKDGEIIDIDVTELPATPIGRPNRSATETHVSCLYYTFLQSVTLTFEKDFGSVQILVSNLQTGVSNTYSHVGTGTCPVSLNGEGLTVIDIYTQTGQHFQAILNAVSAE